MKTVLANQPAIAARPLARISQRFLKPFESSRGSSRQLISRISRQSIWLLLILSTAVFAHASPHFLTGYNLSSILLESASIGFLGIGMTFLIGSGNLDLSVGSTVALAGVLSVSLLPYGLSIALLVTLLITSLVGIFIGVLIRVSGVPSFIVTLAAMMALRGLVFALTNEQSISATDDQFTNLGSLSLGPIPAIGVLYLALTLVAHFILTDTVHGRNTIAIGSNVSVAESVGIRAGRHIIANFGMLGFLAGLSGISLAMQMGSATPVLGKDYELWTIAAVVLGGTRLTGGLATVIGTLAGVLEISVLQNGMGLLNVPPFFVYIVLGGALIAALLFNRPINYRYTHSPAANTPRL